MYKEYEPNEKICKRMSQVWRKMLEAPKYDNGDETDNGGIAAMLGSMQAKNNTPEVLVKFEEELFNLLMTKSLKYTADDEGRYPDYLDVDYHPCQTLTDAADKAGLKMEFPWKTTSRISADYISVSAGYGARSTYHYPLEDGSWLLTTLCGDDRDVTMLKEYATEHPDKFTIEKDIENEV